jgi:peptidoglycan/LPS O-acetylase OafA/YrhL
MLQGKLDIEGHAIDNPIGILPFADGEEAIQPAFLAFFPLMLLSASSLVARFRKAKAEERQQLKLLIWGASIFVVTTILGDRLDLPEVLFPLTLWMIPAAIAVAILKYRLYDIDAIINRTLVYALLTALLGLIYFGIVVILQQVLSPVTQQSDLAIAGSTLAVAALFRPMRSRVQEFIDRRFYRRRYDATETLETFSARLRDRVDLPSLTDDLVTVVATTMEPAHASIWLRKPSIE